ncbi:type VII secretion protein EccE [Gordonia caeni]
MRMRRAHRTRPASAPFDVPYGDGYLGVRHDAGTLLTVLALGPGPSGPVRLDRPWPQTVPGAGLSWNLLSQWMSGADAAATELTVLTHGSSGRGAGPAWSAYRTLIGPLSVAAHRSVHLAIRFAPLAHPGLVARYGDGTAAALRACLSGTRRLADRLAGDGLTAAPLSAAELTRLTDQLTAGTERSAAYAVDPADPAGLPAALEAAWRAGAAATTALRWRSGAAGPELTALARIDQPAAPAPAGWVALTGEDRGAPTAALGAAAPLVSGPGPLPAGTLAALEPAVLPTGGAGVIVGADAAGCPVGLRLTGAEIPLAEISGDLLLAQRLVVRLVALGTSAAVFTDRPEHWTGLIDAVADRRLLHPAADGAAEVLIDDRPGGRLGPLDGHTVLRLRPADEDGPPAPGGIRVRQDREEPGSAVLTGAGREVRVRLVATGAEDALVGPARPGTAVGGLSSR